MLKFKNLFGIFLDWFEFCGSYNVQDAWILVILCLDWLQYMHGCFILLFFFSSYSLNLFLKLFHHIFCQHSKSILKSSSSVVAYMLLSFNMESSWKFFFFWPESTHLTRSITRPVSKLWFEMKDLGSLRYFLDIEVAYSPNGHFLSQSKYIANILEWARLTNNKTINTLIEINIKYSSSNVLPLSYSTLYHIIVGSLVYLIITRPDIAYVVHIVSQFVASPITVH